MNPASAGALTGGVTSIAGGQMQNAQQQQVARYNITALQQQANEVSNSAAANEADVIRKGNAALGEQAAAAGQANIGTGGSVAGIERQSAANARLNALNVWYGGQLEHNQYENQANLEQWQLNQLDQKAPNWDVADYLTNKLGAAGWLINPAGKLTGINAWTMLRNGGQGPSQIRSQATASLLGRVITARGHSLMGGGVVRIPTVDQNVGTPQRDRGPALAHDLESPIARGLGIVGQAAQRVGAYSQRAARAQIVLDAADAQEDFQDGAAQIYAQAKQLPGDQWAPTVKQQTDDLAQKILDDPNNQSARFLLAKRLPRLQARIYTEATSAGMVQTAHENDEQLKTLGSKLASQAGSAYQVGTDGQVQDAPVANGPRQQYYNLVDQMWPKNPVMAQGYKTAFENQVVQQRAQAIAIDPNAKPSTLDSFIKSQPGQFDPEQQLKLRNMAIGAVEAPYHQVTAAHEALSAQAITGLDQMATTHDPSLANAAYKARSGGLIDDKQYENYAHSKWRDPYATSAPGLVAGYAKDIDQNPFRYSSADIAAIPADEISPDDRRQLQAHRADSEAFAKKAVGGEYLRSLDSLRSALTPNIIVNKEAVDARVNAALTSMRAAKEEGQFQSVKDVQDMTRRVLDTYQVGKPKQTVQPIKAAPKFAPIAPATAARIAAEARASGWEPGE